MNKQNGLFKGLVKVHGSKFYGESASRVGCICSGNKLVPPHHGTFFSLFHTGEGKCDGEKFHRFVNLA